MKKLLFLAVALAGSFAAQAQGLDFGIKAGANFANLNGDVNTDGITGFHAGAVLELSIVPMFSIQAEGLFSTQGAEAKYEETFGEAVVTGARELNLNYISVPIMAKVDVIPEFVSIMAGPQFSFLVSDAEEAFDKPQNFDLGATAGVQVDLIAGVFAQARYTVGFTDVYDQFDSKNAVFQLSVGYKF